MFVAGEAIECHRDGQRAAHQRLGRRQTVRDVGEE
jgi:hypothetical protein